MRSKNFDKWKNYYDNGLISKAKLHNLVGKVLGITADEYTLITGDPYEN